MKAYVMYVQKARERGLLIAFEHVKGHSGHPLNERADVLSREAIKECIKSLGTL